MNYSIHIR